MRDIKIVKNNIETMKGLVFKKKVSHSAGWPTRMENAKIVVKPLGPKIIQGEDSGHSAAR
ncbi:hypothetical protein ACE6H2_022894 [Prunus campanulata]